MSRLKLFRGDRSASAPAVSGEHAPGVLSYETHFQHWRDYRNNAVARARTLRNNDECPECHRRLVKPLELANAVMSRNNLPIPGTATLVGFHCLKCDWEWSA
ncbi:MAG: hypothetical protein ACE5KM_02090 [Planctomycetaceae bacterium]